MTFQAIRSSLTRVQAVFRVLLYPQLRFAPVGNHQEILATARRQGLRHAATQLVLYVFTFSLMTSLIAEKFELRWLVRPSGLLALISLVTFLIVPEICVRLSLRRAVREFRAS